MKIQFKVIRSMVDVRRACDAVDQLFTIYASKAGKATIKEAWRLMPFVNVLLPSRKITKSPVRTSTEPQYPGQSSYNRVRPGAVQRYLKLSYRAQHAAKKARMDRLRIPRRKPPRRKALAVLKGGRGGKRGITGLRLFLPRRGNRGPRGDVRIGPPSRPGTPPHSHTGGLRRSLVWAVDKSVEGIEAWVISTIWWSIVHEKGGTRHPPRPFLITAFRNVYTRILPVLRHMRQLQLNRSAIGREMHRGILARFSRHA